MTGFRLKELRIENSLTQQQVAKIMSITRSAYSNYENGLRMPEMETLKNVAKDNVDRTFKLFS